MKNFTFFIFTISLVLIVSGCGFKSHERSSDGGQDVGGGSALLSSEADVQYAIQESYSLFMNFPNYHQFYTLSFRTLIESLKDSEVSTIVEKVFFPGGWEGHLTAASYLKKSQILIQSQGACPSPDKNHVDASVSSHKIGSTICFNIQTLRKIPKESLVKEITSLIAHEAAHLQGFGEKEAQMLQSKIKEEMLEVDSFYDLPRVLKVMRKNLLDAKELIAMAQDVLEKEPLNPRSSYLAATIESVLHEKMPYHKFPQIFLSMVFHRYDAKTLESVFKAYKKARSANLRIFWVYATNLEDYTKIDQVALMKRVNGYIDESLSILDSNFAQNPPTEKKPNLNYEKPDAMPDFLRDELAAVPSPLFQEREEWAIP